MLGVCTNGEMDWLNNYEVITEYSGKEYQIQLKRLLSKRKYKTKH